jgi:hypothetical protein
MGQHERHAVQPADDLCLGSPEGLVALAQDHEQGVILRHGHR